MHKTKHRITIMDGEVVDFARGFREREGAGFPQYDALGPYELSASRNAVIVEHATLRSSADVIEFIAAVREADAEARRLSRERSGNYRDDR